MSSRTLPAWGLRVLRPPSTASASRALAERVSDRMLDSERRKEVKPEGHSSEDGSRQRALPLKFTGLSGRQKLRAKALPVARPGREPPQLSTTWRNASQRVVCRASSGSMGCPVPRHRAGLSAARARPCLTFKLWASVFVRSSARVRACRRRVAVIARKARAQMPFRTATILIRALSYGCAPKAQLTYGSSTAITDSLR